jgi:hypothetical protein
VRRLLPRDGVEFALVYLGLLALYNIVVELFKWIS